MNGHLNVKFVYVVYVFCQFSNVTDVRIKTKEKPCLYYTKHNVKKSGGAAASVLKPNSVWS